MAVSGGLALVTFIVNTLAPSVDALGPLQKLSPFYYYMGNQPLINGFDPFDTAMLAGISVAALAVALITFERRDLAT